MNGKRVLIVWHTHAVAGLDPETGKKLWQYPLGNSIGVDGADRSARQQIAAISDLLLQWFAFARYRRRVSEGRLEKQEQGRTGGGDAAEHGRSAQHYSDAADPRTSTSMALVRMANCVASI